MTILWVILMSLVGSNVSAVSQRSDDDPKNRYTEHVIDTRRLDYLQEALAVVDEDATRFAFWIASANTAGAVFNSVTGAVSADRGAVGPAIGAFAGAGFSLASAIVGFTSQRTPFHSVYQNFVAHRQIAQPNFVIREAEAQWLSKAERERGLRKTTGIIYTSVGAAIVAFSTAALLKNSPLPSQEATNNDRAAFTGLVTGLGSLMLSNGIALLIVKGPIQSSWQSYTLGRSSRQSSQAALGISPSDRGGRLTFEIDY